MLSTPALLRSPRSDRPTPSVTPAVTAGRIASIDALRGLVMLLMLVDHAREFFFLHAQVSDPMDLEATAPGLAVTRLAAHLCAPVFVALTGLAAWLYAAPRGGAAAASAFLAKRGLFLIALELTVVSFAWTFDPTPSTLFLQVIWAIGVSMLALAALVHLPRAAVAAIGLAIVAGHNLLDPIAFAPGTPGHAIWAVVHDRGFIDLPWGGRARTSYPVLPWIGVIALGWAIGPWFARGADAQRRRRALWWVAGAALAAFAALRLANGYGDPVPWRAGEDAGATAIAILNVTKYPPSLDFLLLTLGLGAGLLATLERVPAGLVRVLAVFGAAPLFFYILHLYLLHLANHLVATATEAEGMVSVPAVGWLWLLAAAVAVPCWFACRHFGRAKRASGAWWMRYL
jgi:uncharacterized membrane protein